MHLCVASDTCAWLLRRSINVLEIFIFPCTSLSEMLLSYARLHSFLFTPGWSLILVLTILLHCLQVLATRHSVLGFLRLRRQVKGLLHNEATSHSTGLLLFTIISPTMRLLVLFIALLSGNKVLKLAGFLFENPRIHHSIQLETSILLFCSSTSSVKQSNNCCELYMN